MRYGTFPAVSYRVVVLSVALLCALLLPLAVAADTHTVAPGGDIQAAIDAAADGDTIELLAGTHTGAMNLEGRHDLTIAGVGRDAVLYRPSTTLGWNVASYGEARQTAIRIVNSTNIVLSGITLDQQDIRADQTFGLLVWNASATFDANRFINASIPPGDPAVYHYYSMVAYVRAPGPPYLHGNRAPVAFTGNEFKDTGRVGIVCHDFVAMTIHDNTFQQNTTPALSGTFGYAMEIGSTATGTVDGNLISGYNVTAAADGSESAGIYIENAFTDGMGPITKNVTVANNEVSNCQYGLWIGNEYAGYTGNVDIVVTLTGNFIHDNSADGVYMVDEGLDAGSSNTLNATGNVLTGNIGNGYNFFTNNNGSLTASVSGDTITGNGRAFLVDQLPAAPPTSSVYDITFSMCRIAGNTLVATNNIPSVTLQAENIWWGCNAGPGNPGCSAAPVGVDYTPWLTLSLSAIPATVPAGGGTATLDANLFTNSASVDLSGTGTFPSGGSATFGATLGTVVSPVTLTAGSASSVFTAGAAQGPASISATLDGQTVSTTITVGNAVPTLTSLSPPSVVKGTVGPVTLTVNGTNFVEDLGAGGSVIKWNGISLGTTFDSDTRLFATLTTARMANAGSFAVTVTNPAPAGGVSNAVDFVVNNPAAVLTSMAPNKIATGSAGFTLTLTGSGYVSGAVAYWTAGSVVTPLTTTFGSATQLTAAVPAALVAAAGSATVQVKNPTPNLGDSASLTFEVSTPATVYVDDGYVGLALGTAVDWPYTGSGTHVIGLDAFATVQGGIDRVGTGGTVNVAAGTYAEAVVVNKALTLLGPNAGIAGYGVRGPEALIVPPAILNAGSSPREWDWNAVVDLESSQVTLDGFSVSCDNPALDGYHYAGMNVEAGIAVYSEGNQVTFRNNVVAKGTVIGFWAGGTQTLSYSGLVVADNLFDSFHDLNQLGYGFGMYIQATAGTVSGNRVTNCRNGMQIQPYRVVGTPTSVTGNTVSNWRTGIYYNYAEEGASAWTITGNSVTACAAPAMPTGPVAWDGIKAETMMASAHGGIISNNTVNGLAALGDPAHTGWGGFAQPVWGLHYAGSASTSTQVVFTGNTVTNVSFGMVHDAAADIAFAGNSLSATGQALVLQRSYNSAGVEQAYGGTNNVDATGGNVINGVASGTATPAQLFAIEDAIRHKVDYPTLGLVRIRPLNLYVTPSSYVAPSTTAASIQRAIDAASAGDTVNVGDGAYAETNLTLNKALTVAGQSQAGVVIKPSTADPDVEGSFPAGFNYAFLLQSGDITIRDLTVDGDDVPGGHNFRAGVMTDHRLSTLFNNITVQGVTVQNTWRRGIQLFCNAATQSSGHLITGNTVTGVVGSSDAVGIIGFDTTDTTVSGNTVSDVTNGFEMVQWSATGGSKITVKSNTFSGVVTGVQLVVPAQDSVIGGPLPTDGNTITVTGAGAGDNDGIIVRDATGTVTVQNNTVNATGPANGLAMFGNSDPTHPVLVLDNTFTATGSTRATAGEGTGVFLTDDTLLFGNASGDPQQDLPTYATLTGNTVTGFLAGVHLYRNGVTTAPGGQIVSATLTENALTGGAIGVLFQGGAAGSATHNDLSSNSTFGIQNLNPAGSLDGTCNWWGHASGPSHATNPSGTGSLASDRVTFEPWSVTSVAPYDCNGYIPPVLSETHLDVACFGDSTGSIDLTVTGGLAPYSYLWSNGQTTEDLSGLAEGLYSVTVTDAHSAQATLSVTILQPKAPISFTTTDVNPTCNAGLDGSITFLASGGTGTLSYSIDGGVTYQTEPLFGSLGARIYSLAVRDENLCVQTGTTTLTEPSAIVASVAVTSPILICGGTATVTITASGGTGALTYTFDGGSNDTGVFPGVSAGTGYGWSVADASACAFTGAPLDVTEPAPPVVGATNNGPVCAGATLQLSSSATGLVATKESVSNALDCPTGSDYASGTVVAPTSGMTVEFWVKPSPDSDFGGVLGWDDGDSNELLNMYYYSTYYGVTGVSAKPQGPRSKGKGVHPPVRTKGTPAPKTNDGPVDIVVELLGGSTYFDEFAATGEWVHLALTLTQNSLRGGEASRVNSRPPVTYTWRLYRNGLLSQRYDVTDPDELSALESALANATSLYAGSDSQSYYGDTGYAILDDLRIWDGARSDAEVLANYSTESPTAKAKLAGALIHHYTFNQSSGAAADSIDTSGNSDLTLHSAYDPGPPPAGEGPAYVGSTVPFGGGSYSYSWTGPNDFASTEQNPALPNADPDTMQGTYSVTITNTVTLCSAEATTEVTIHPVPTAAITPSGPTAFCQGGSVTLDAGVHDAYLWSPNGETTQTVDVSTSGSYTVTVTDLGCTSAPSDAIVVTVIATPPNTVYVDQAYTGLPTGTVVTWPNTGGSGPHVIGCDAFATIQGGVDAVAPGGTVNVADGTYVENVTIGKALTLTGQSEAGTILQPLLDAPDPAGCASSLCAGASNIILVQASDVTLQNMTLEGDPAGTGTPMARNGIITDHTLSQVFNNVNVNHTTVRNIFLRGIYQSTGGTFTFDSDTVDNVQGNGSSIGIFSFGSAGTVSNCTVSNCNDGISANHSRGIAFTGNGVSNSGSGIHTDNAGDGGGSADLIDNNEITSCDWGIWVFVPYIAPTVQNNTVDSSNVLALAVAGGAFSPSPTVETLFKNNTVYGLYDGGGDIGFYETATTWYWGETDVKARLEGNSFDGLTYGIITEPRSKVLTLSGAGNAITFNSLGFWADAPTGTGSQVIQFNRNDIAENGDGLYSLDTLSPVALDFSCNWWNDGTGPATTTNPSGAGDTLSGAGEGHVTYAPWSTTGPGYQLPADPPPYTCEGYVAPSMSSADLAGPYTVGVSQQFHATATNPPEGRSYTNVRFDFLITGAVLADIVAFEYSVDGGTTWLPMPLTQNGSDVTGYFGPPAGFPLPVPYSATTPFRITFATSKLYPVTITLNDVSGVPVTLATLSAVAQVNAGAPAITGITDNEACAQDGVRIAYTPGAGATSHTLVDGAILVPNYLSGALYNPGDTASHTYIIRAVGGAGTTDTDSPGSSYADVNDTPTAVSNLQVTNPDCSGATVTFTASPNASSYELWVDGALVGPALPAGTAYVPADRLAHNYVIRAIQNTCHTDSTPVSFAVTDLYPPRVTDSLMVSKTGNNMLLQWALILSPGVVDYYEVGRFNAVGPPVLEQIVGTASGSVNGIQLDLSNEPANANYLVRAVKGNCHGPWE